MSESTPSALAEAEAENSALKQAIREKNTLVNFLRQLSSEKDARVSSLQDDLLRIRGVLEQDEELVAEEEQAALDEKDHQIEVVQGEIVRMKGKVESFQRYVKENAALLAKVEEALVERNQIRSDLGKKMEEYRSDVIKMKNNLAEIYREKLIKMEKDLREEMIMRMPPNDREAARENDILENAIFQQSKVMSMVKQRAKKLDAETARQRHLIREESAFGDQIKQITHYKVKLKQETERFDELKEENDRLEAEMDEFRKGLGELRMTDLELEEVNEEIEDLEEELSDMEEVREKLERAAKKKRGGIDVLLPGGRSSVPKLRRRNRRTSLPPRAVSVAEIFKDRTKKKRKRDKISVRVQGVDIPRFLVP